MGGEFLEGEFFRGPLLLKKTESRKSGPKFGRPKFVSQNSAPNSGFGGAKSPVQKFVPDTLDSLGVTWGSDSGSHFWGHFNSFCVSVELGPRRTPTS